MSINYRQPSSLANSRVFAVSYNSNCTSSPANVTTGRKCGASYIDHNFLNVFLPKRLGQETFKRITTYDLSESQQYGQGSNVSLNRNLQTLLERFLDIKHDFRGPEDQPARLGLTGNIDLQNDPARGIEDGQLLITR